MILQYLQFTFMTAFLNKLMSLLLRAEDIRYLYLHKAYFSITTSQTKIQQVWVHDNGNLLQWLGSRTDAAEEQNIESCSFRACNKWSLITFTQTSIFLAQMQVTNTVCDNVIPVNIIGRQVLRLLNYQMIQAFLEIKIQFKLSYRCSLLVAALSLVELHCVVQFRSMSAFEKVLLISQQAGEHYQCNHSETDYPI